jgi:hypothetical protein
MDKGFVVLSLQMKKNTVSKRCPNKYPPAVGLSNRLNKSVRKSFKRSELVPNSKNHFIPNWLLTDLAFLGLVIGLRFYKIKMVQQPRINKRLSIT